MPNWKKLIVSGSGGALTTLRLSGLSNQAEEATALMINGSDVVGTRELGSNAFNSTTIPTNNNELDNGAGYITSFTNTVDMGDGFKVQDGDGTEVTIDENKYWKFVEGESIDINFTDTSNGSEADPFDLTFALKPAGAGSGTYGSTANGTKIDTITIDEYGRVTAVATGATGTSTQDTNTMGEGFTVAADTNTATTTITENDTLTIKGGTNISTVSNPDGTITINNGVTNNNQLTNGAGYITNSVTTLSSLTSIGTLTRLTVDDIDIDGSTISDAGDLTLDIGGDLNIDVDGTDIILKDGGTSFGRFKRDNSNFIIKSEAQDKDIVFRGNDGGSTIDALTLDMSGAGLATFNSGINAGGAVSGVTRLTVDNMDFNGNTVTAVGNLNLSFSSELNLEGLSAQNSEATSLMIDTDGNVGTRELGSNAFNSTTIPSSISDFGETLAEGFNLNETNLSEFNNDLTMGATLSNGVDNRVVTATGASTITGEQYLTYSGGILQIDATSGYGKLRVGYGSTSSPAIHFDDDTDTGISGASANMYFSIGGLARMTLNANGLRVDDAIGVNVAASTTDGRIDAGNDIVAYSTSDERLKENVKPIENALDKVSKIGGYEFDWKQLTEKEKETIHGNEGHDVGVLAQEIEKVLPEVVTQRDSGYKAVKYEKIVPLLIESIKELKSEIEELKRGR